ncbi:transcriptional regulator [Aliivibrio fischeri]|uniref:helix-turn-helix domain-containing protein n=1 Tax=Aliivibrio fischeri TaxID=668 RepID=UPI00084BE42B|nr:helix-turn-helix transcriptional regulator [Aliivibrio fischeri]OED54675.1 transcriptional regulator [Aliivibrio fischeri]
MERENPIPKRLKEARQRAKITQKELGIRIGMEESSASGRMNHYEKGRHTPDVSVLQRMAKELNVPLSYFFCESDSLAELNRIMGKMSEEERNALIKQLSSKEPNT